jgi:hypothetical protein
MWLFSREFVIYKFKSGVLFSYFLILSYNDFFSILNYVALTLIDK